MGRGSKLRLRVCSRPRHPFFLDSTRLWQASPLLLFYHPLCFAQHALFHLHRPFHRRARQPRSASRILLAHRRLTRGSLVLALNVTFGKMPMSMVQLMTFDAGAVPSQVCTNHPAYLIPRSLTSYAQCATNCTGALTTLTVSPPRRAQSARFPLPWVSDHSPGRTLISPTGMHRRPMLLRH